jgi:TonB-linked SusC/RagA family outer membrane protein
MKKLLLSLFILFLIVTVAIAQDRTVTGTVTAREDGLALPGVSVKVKGTTVGTQTGSDGKYLLKVPAGSTTLTFTYIGYATRDIPISANNIVNVSLSTDATQLGEVVVTALGIRREKRALGYSVQEVQSENLTYSKSVDVSTALAGKVSGVQLAGSPSSSFDNANIVIRGINGLAPTIGGGNGTLSYAGGNVRDATSSGITSFAAATGTPLFIVDGTPTPQQNVLMENVESISVLKGASATALYGNRAANGVVVITSKKGAKTPTVEFNLGATFENTSVTPSYQNQYAGGYSSSYANKDVLGEGYLDPEGFYIFNYDPEVHPAEWANFNGQRMLEYGGDESWGPKIAGQEYRPYYSWFPGAEFGSLSPLTAHPDNIRNFFRTGTNLNNSVAVSGGGDNFLYRLMYSNQYRTLIQPGADREQNQFSLNGSYDVSKRFKVSSDITFTTNDTKGQPYEGYRNDGLNVAQGFNQWFQRQLDLDRLKNYRRPDGTIMSWNIGDPNSTGDLDAITRAQYWDSPWFVANENYQTSKRNYLSGSMGVNYSISDVFSVSGYARLNSTSGRGDFRMATGGLQLDAYSTNQYSDNEMNYEGNLNFKKAFGDISLDGFVGGNIRLNRFEMLENSTAGGLSYPNYFDIAASVARPVTTRYINNKDVWSLYGKASFGYKNYLYLDATLRNDWSSALPSNNNSYLYPSVSTSFVFSELLKGGIKDILSFAKIRGSYAQVGSDLGFNQVFTAINNGSIFNGNSSFEIGNQYRTGKVKPALTKSWEVGAEARFINRLGLELSYYVDNNTNQILSLEVPPASGFNTYQINAGNIQRKGWELSLSGSPIKSKDFNWDVTFNFAHSTSIVKELTSGLNTYEYGNTWNDTYLYNMVGKEWGVIVGRKWKTDEQGRTVFASSNGTVDYNTNQEIASIIPDLTGGMYNTLRYKGVDLSFSLDFQKGGNFFSTTKMFNLGTGLSKYTVGVNDKGNDIRTYPADGGGVRMDGVLPDGTPTTVYVPARRYYYTNLQRDARNFVLDASYLKLREVRLGYAIPKKVFGRAPIKGANLGVIASNLWLISAPAKKWGVDPSEVENLWTEGGQLPSTRQYGINLRVSF